MSTFEYKENIAEYNLTEFPGSTGDIMISHGMWVNPNYRGQGIGNKTHKRRLAEAARLGKSYLMCTCNMTNEVELHILDRHGWKKLDEFISECSCERIGVFGRMVNYDDRNLDKGLD